MKKSLFLWTFLLICSLLLVSCSYNTSTSNGSSSNSSGSTIQTPNWGNQTKTSNCQINGPLQDLQCTPGAIITTAIKSKICVSGYAKSVRNVPQSEKNQVYREYGITHHTAGQYEVDHLVSLELGGSNDIANLWPEAASPKPGFHQKDQVENYLHNQVCAGKIDLKTAQAEIATNWLTVYKQVPSNYSGSDDENSIQFGSTPTPSSKHHHR